MGKYLVSLKEESTKKRGDSTFHCTKSALWFKFAILGKTGIWMSVDLTRLRLYVVLDAIESDLSNTISELD